MKDEEEERIFEEARMNSKKEESAQLMAEEEKCIAEETRLKDKEEKQASLKSE